MPSLPEIPDFPGKGAIGDTSRRVRLVAAGAGLAAVAVGGVVLRKALGRGSADEPGATADPIAETPTAPEPEPEPAPESELEEPTIPVPRPEPAPSGPGDISGDAEPHHALNTPVGEEPPESEEEPPPERER